MDWSVRAIPDAGGPEPVGIRRLTLTDESRPDPVESEQPRTFDVLLWYPAREEGEPSPHMGRRMLAGLQDEGYYGQTTETFEAWGSLSTESVQGAAPREGKMGVVLLSHGLGMATVHYSAIAQELASHGFAVIAPEHPYGGFGLRPDDGVHSTAGDALLATEPGFDQRAGEWAEDLLFLLDAVPEAWPELRLDLEGVVALGHSMGGVAAMDAAARDERIVGAINMDGAPMTRTEATGLRAPTLVLKSLPAMEEPELAPGDPILSIWRSLAERGGAACTYAGVFGSGHTSFSDAPFLLPDTLTRFGTQLAPREELHAVVSGLLLAFVRHVRSESEAPFAFTSSANVVTVPIGI